MDQQNDDGPDRCPLCDTDCKVDKKSRFTQIDCRVCGLFRLTGGGASSLKKAGAPYRSAGAGDASENRIKAHRIAAGDENKPSDYELVAFLSCHTRQSWESGRVVDVNRKWRADAKRHQATSVRSNTEKLLRYLATKSRRPGISITITPEEDWTVIDATRVVELDSYFEHIQEQGLISGFRRKPREDLTVTINGWEVLEPLRKDQIEPGRVFVARSYQDDLDDLFDSAISPAIAEVGAVAVDGKMPPEGEPNREITERIRSEIVRAEVVIADCSGHRPNVYFEIGYAMGLGRPVILTCRERDLKTAHFDTRQFHHIKWIKREDLQQELPIWLRPRLARKAPKA